MGHGATDLASFAHFYLRLLAGAQMLACNSIKINCVVRWRRLRADSINKNRVNTYLGGDVCK
jgi:hypothetical protein